MSADFQRTRPNETRRPEFTELPDGRKRLTRYFDYPDGTRITDDLVKPYGTLDAGDTDAPTEGFAGLRLINQYLERDQTKRDSTQSVYVEVYEELDETEETQIGNLTTVQLEDGRTAYEGEFWQFVAGTFVPGTVGVTTAPGHASAYLQKVEAPDDGTLRRIKRTYVEAGIIATDDQSLQGGKLLKKTITSVKSVPATPSGFTLVGSPVQAPGGLPVYTYTYYKGDGEVNRVTRESNGGALQTVEITHLTALSVDTNPTSDPLSGGSAMEIGKREADGHRIWTVRWVKGSGEVGREINDHLDGRVTYTTIRAFGAPVAATGEFETGTEEGDGYTIYRSRGIVVNDPDLPDEVTTRNKGALIITRKRKINAAPTGTGEVILDTADPADGYTLHTKAFAVGDGLVSTQLTDALDGAITYETKRAYGTAVPATGEFATTTEDDDGYTVYVSRGIIINSADLPDEVTTRNNGALVITRKRKINAAPTGTGNVIQESADPQEGYTLYTKAFAVGYGLVTTQNQDHFDGRVTYTTKRAYGTPEAATGEFETTTEEDDGYTVYVSRGIFINDADLPDEVTTRNGGKLVITRKRKINSAPTGTGSVIQESADPQEGYTLYTKAFAVGDGLVVDASRKDQKGKLVHYRREQYGAAPDAPAATIGGSVVLVGAEVRNDDGFDVYVYEWTEGVGLVSVSIRPRNDGLREQTYVSLGTKQTPAGVPIEDTEQDEAGVTRYSVTCMQTADGGATVTDATVQTEEYVVFEYPGRAKAFSETLNSRKMLDVFRSPPVSALVLATVKTTYQTTDAVGTLDETLWNPTEWATLRAQWIGLRDEPVNQVEALPGYRTEDDTPVEETCSAVAPNDVSIFGNIVFGSTTARITVTGGPEDPGGNTYTLERPRVELAFQAVDGTKYYRRTVVEATIPAQAALPV